MQFEVKTLDVSHNRNNFDCGITALNTWLQTMAMQQQTKDLTRTFVAVDSAQPQTILGYVTLTVGAVQGEDVPGKGNHPRQVPVAIIGRLAVALKYQKQRIGETLLLDAFTRILCASDHVGIKAIVVDAKDQHAARYYQGYGFLPSPMNPLRLFLPLATVTAAQRQTTPPLGP